MAIQKKLKRQAKSSEYHKIYFWNNKKTRRKNPNTDFVLNRYFEKHYKKVPIHQKDGFQ
jgi:hypothetical protein